MEWRGQRSSRCSYRVTRSGWRGQQPCRRPRPHEWIAHPAPSTFTLAAALGWAIQDLACLGLHAAPLRACLRPHLAPGRRALVLLRDGAAVATWPAG
jgi:precorrin-6Y C5,15-methyltransferase (decarboxylating)